LSDQGPFLPTEALRQTIQCDMAALPAVIAALGFRSVEEDGELRFHAAQKKQRRAKGRRPGKQPAQPTGDSPFAALGDLKFRR
jgi:hypothetical protein